MDGLTNMMEEAVIQSVDSMWSTNQNCTCERCRKDVIVYALNRLPARYVASLEEAMIHKFDTCTVQMAAEMTATVVRGIQHVGESPNHE